MIYRCNEFESKLFDPFADGLPEVAEVPLPLELPELAELLALPDFFEVLFAVLFAVLAEDAVLVEVLDADSCEFVPVALVSAACAV